MTHEVIPYDLENPQPLRMRFIGSGGGALVDHPVQLRVEILQATAIVSGVLDGFDFLFDIGFLPLTERSYPAEIFVQSDGAWVSCANVTIKAGEFC